MKPLYDTKHDCMPLPYRYVLTCFLQQFTFSRVAGKLFDLVEILVLGHGHVFEWVELAVKVMCRTAG